MIRVRYSNLEVVEYSDVELANFMAINTLFATHGYIEPIEAVEVMGHTSGGVSVERVLSIKLGFIQSGWDA